MPTAIKAHPYAPTCLLHPVRHKDEFTPPQATAQRCNCGSRNWIINVGGSMPAQVACARCSNNNRTATAYVAGYAARMTDEGRPAAGPAGKEAPW